MMNPKNESSPIIHVILGTMYHINKVLHVVNRKKKKTSRFNSTWLNNNHFPPFCCHPNWLVLVDRCAEAKKITKTHYTLGNNFLIGTQCVLMWNWISSLFNHISHSHSFSTCMSCDCFKTHRRTAISWMLTWVFPAYRMDPSAEQTAASLLSPAGRCCSGPALSDCRTASWALRPELHSFSRSAYNHSAWIGIRNEIGHNKLQISIPIWADMQIHSHCAFC